METFFEFMTNHGRVPTIEDTPKPWEYRGHLLYYNQLIQSMNGFLLSSGGSDLALPFPDRWGYFLGGCTEDIPKIHFQSVFAIPKGNECVKMMRDLIRKGDRYWSMWETFSRLTKWMAYGMGVDMPGDHEDVLRIPMEVQENWYRTLDLAKFLKAPADHFGHFICDNMGTGWNPHAFFPTPDSVVEAMTQIMFHDEKDHKTKSVMDPCVGTGRMLLHAGNYSLNLHGADIDPLMVRCTLLSGAIYVPWLSFRYERVREINESVEFLEKIVQKMMGVYVEEKEKKESPKIVPTCQISLFESLRCEEGESLHSETVQKLRMRMKSGIVGGSGSLF